MREIFISRTKLLSLIIILLALLLLSKLIMVQLLRGEDYSNKADRQYVSPASSLYDRGFIYFKNKDGTPFLAATLKTGYTLAINPSVLEDKKAVYEALSQIIPNLEREDFFLKAGKKNDPYEELAHRLEREKADAVLELDLSGVIIRKEKWRFYPREFLAAHVIGFVGYRDDNFGGRYGIERYYNDVLNRGEEDLYVNFFAEIFANIEQTLFYNNSREGDVVMSIEPEVQQILEDTLDGIMEKWNADAVGGIIINPKTGTLYAMGVRPTYNLNDFALEEDYLIFSNPLVESVYEMGSIVKPLTVAVGIDTGVITPESTYNDKGYIILDTARIENYDGKARGIVSIQEVLNQSLNTGAVYVMQETGKELFREYFKNLGFGEETGIDLPGEVAGLISNLDSPRDLEYATAAFGQGIAMTPIGMVRALSSLANKGILVTPHVGDYIKYPLRPSRYITYGDDTRIFKEETTETVTRMLVEVVDDALLGGTVALDNYSIAAKTGTAQIAHPDGGYYNDRFLHSFFGYFPAYDPKFLIFLYTVNPKEVRYASQTLTYPFMDNVKFLINYYTIPPDR